MKRTTATLTTALLMAVAFTAAGCGQGGPTLVLATTTSTLDSGLLDVLLPEFEKRNDVDVKPIGVGTGEALEMGARGDADVVLAHSKTLEEKFVKEGYGLERVEVMYNDYVILGPESDPAGAGDEKSAKGAFTRIAEAGVGGKAVFLSRGDGSGTNTTELGLWKKVGVEPEGQSWYIATGQGMGETLAVADEKQAYTLADRATCISRQGNELKVLYEGDPALHNQYSVEVVNPEKHPGLKLNVERAGDFVEFLTSEAGQEIIGEYKLKGAVLFHPNSKGETRGMGGYEEPR